MPASWNDTFTDALDWSSLDFLNQFRDALYERYSIQRTQGPGTYTAPSGYLPLAEGDDVQGTFLRDMQNALVDLIRFPSDLTYGEGWIDPSWDPSTSGRPTIWDVPDALVAAGISTAKFWRKRPREVDLTSDPVLSGGIWTATSGSTDTQGNTIADGMLAWGMRTGKRTRLYTYDAGNSEWTTDGVAATDVPDLLDSRSAAPDTVDSVDTYDVLEPGDYIGPWIFNEMRDVINVLVTRYQNFLPAGSGVTAHRTGSSGLVGSYTTAKSDAETAFDGATPDLSSTDGWGSFTYATLSGGSYQGTMIRVQFESGPLTNPGAIKQDVEWWVDPAAPTIGGSPQQSFFDSYPDAPPLTLGWCLLHSVSGSTTTDPTYTFPSDNTSHPAWPAAPTGGVPSKGNGWQITNRFAIMKYQITGGFAYTSDT